MPMSRKPRRRLARLLGSLAALTLALGATVAGPTAKGAELLPGVLPSLPLPSILPSLPLPSLPLPSLPIPSLPIPSIPIPSVPVPSVSLQPSATILPSLPIPSIPLPSLINQPSSSGSPSIGSSGSSLSSGPGSIMPTDSSGDPSPQQSASTSGGESEESAGANGVFTAASPSGGAQPPSGEVFGGPFGPIGLPQLVGAGSAAFLVGLLALYLAAGAGWLAVVRRKLGGIGVRVTAWREERLRGRYPGA